MKTHSSTQDQDSKPRAAARQADQRAASFETAVKKPSEQSRQQSLIDASPYMAAQRKRLTGMSGTVIQNQGPEEDEELLQGKFAAQRVPEEEEELMQGKFAAQRMAPEEEELMQGKFTTQRQSSLEDEEMMQGKFAAQRAMDEDEELMQGKFPAQLQTADDAIVKVPTQQKAKPLKENKTGMPDAVKSKMETTFGTDFSAVKVHPNSTKAVDVDALAYTQGTDVHFAPGQFKPESSTGIELLGHELAHVQQQRMQSIKPTKEVAGLPVNDSPELEKDADEMGEKVLKVK
jgi:hypothetical protein